MTWKFLKVSLACLLLLISLTECDGGRKERLPASTGQPYEVVLEGDSENVVTQMLQQDIPALPQPEPMFQIIQVRKDKLKGSYLLVRTRIIVDIDKRHSGYAVVMRQDVNASPQMVIRIMARSVSQLRAKLDGAKLRALIDQSELEHLAIVIQQNAEKQKKVKHLFGLDMKIPASMDASKQGKDFMWISNNANTGMQSLLVFSLKGSKAEGKNHLLVLRHQVDSVLCRNMPGEVDGMYMQLATLSSYHMAQGAAGTDSSKNKCLFYRGLWEMKGDAMGGPYVMTQTGDVVVLGFVYAPEMKKKNLIKQIEAVLTTIKRLTP